MSITLVIETDDLKLTLPRANSKLTSSASFHTQDTVVIGDLSFMIVGFEHRLAPPDNAIAPTSFARLVSLEDGELDDTQILKLMDFGFKP